MRRFRSSPPTWHRVLVCGLVVFGALALLPSGVSAWTLTTRHTFCTQAGCPDGNNPETSLLMVDGRHFFGTTPHGGATTILGGTSDNRGTVYELRP